MHSNFEKKMLYKYHDCYVVSSKTQLLVTHSLLF